MWQKVNEYFQNKKRILSEWYQRYGCLALHDLWPAMLALLIAAIALLICRFWNDEPTKTVTSTSQQQAETSAGVQDAADDAGVKLDAGQAKEVSTVIREIRVTEKEPVYVIQTTGENAKAESEKAAKREQTDFAIVTDKNNPEQEVNLEELDKDTKVELNQYNIQAFKKHINTIEYQPTEKVVGYTHQWKVTDSGRYMGVGADYDIDDKKIYAKITYSW